MVGCDADMTHDAGRFHLEEAAHQPAKRLLNADRLRDDPRRFDAVLQRQKARVTAPQRIQLRQNSLELPGFHADQDVIGLSNMCQIVGTLTLGKMDLAIVATNGKSLFAQGV